MAGPVDAAARPPIQSVARAVRLLKHLSAADVPVSVPVLANACGLQRTTAWRLLITLEEEGLVERERPGGRFRVGYGAVAIAARALDYSRATARIVHPVLEALVRATGESALLSVIRGMRTLLVDEVDPPSVLSVNWVGKEFPLHTSSMGKMLLAHLPPEELDRFLGSSLERLTPRTITKAAPLRTELAKVRVSGMAVSDEEFELGCVGMSVAIGQADRFPAAILTVTGPASRIGVSERTCIARQLKAAAAVAKAALGAGATAP
ncbi:MAG: IclR family transcriptional regulator [Acidimicrobiales bacterium]